MWTHQTAPGRGDRRAAEGQGEHEGRGSSGSCRRAAAGSRCRGRARLRSRARRRRDGARGLRRCRGRGRDGARDCSRRAGERARGAAGPLNQIGGLRDHRMGHVVEEAIEGGRARRVENGHRVQRRPPGPQERPQNGPGRFGAWVGRAGGPIVLTGLLRAASRRGEPAGDRAGPPRGCGPEAPELELMERVEGDPRRRLEAHRDDHARRVEELRSSFGSFGGRSEIGF